MSTSFSGSVKLSDCGSASEQEKCDIGVSVEEFNVERSNGRSKLSVKLPQALQYVGSLDYGNPDNDTSCCAIKMEMDGGASLDKLPQENPKEGTCSVETQGQYQLEQTKEDGSCYDWEKLISDAAPDVLIFNSSTESVTCTEEDNNMVDFDATSFALVSHPPQDEVDGLHNAQPVSSLHQQQQQQQQQQNPINQLEEVEDGEQKETDHTPQLLPSVYQNEQDTGDLCEKMDEKVGDCISLGKKARLGGEDIGYSFRRDLKLISEVQAPFRGVRRFFYVAFSAAAGISTFFTIPRLIDAVKGGDDAPDIWETSGNAAINIGGIIVLVALFFWDNKKEEEQLAQISRDETLSRLPLRLSTNRIVELVQLRDTSRPVILAGRKESVSAAIQKAERFRTELIKRGVLLIPVIWGEDGRPPMERKGFGLTPKAATSLPSIGDDFEKRTQSITAKSRLKSEVRFKAEIVSPDEWERWIRDQQKSEGVNTEEDVYIILRLDGRVRRSGKGMPDWQQIAKELPPLEGLLSKLER